MNHQSRKANAGHIVGGSASNHPKAAKEDVAPARMPAPFPKRWQRTGQAEPNSRGEQGGARARSWLPGAWPRKAREKQRGAGQEEPDSTERGEALLSHTLPPPSQIPQGALFLHPCLPVAGWKQRVGCFGALLDFTTSMPSLCWNDRHCGKPSLCSATTARLIPELAGVFGVATPGLAPP